MWPGQSTFKGSGLTKENYVARASCLEARLAAQNSGHPFFNEPRTTYLNSLTWVGP